MHDTDVDLIKMSDVIIRPIIAADDAQIARIIRDNLKAYHLDIPGTAYFDPELDSLSAFFGALPEKRMYYIAVRGNGTVIGGAGVAEFTAFPDCGEIQKLYLSDGAKGKGIGKRLMQTVEDFAKSAGYSLLYLETHANLQAAMRLYEKLGFRQIEKPTAVFHSAMNRFYKKQI